MHDLQSSRPASSELEASFQLTPTIMWVSAWYSLQALLE